MTYGPEFAYVTILVCCPWEGYIAPSALLAEDQTSRWSSVAEVTVKYADTRFDGVTNFSRGRSAPMSLPSMVQIRQWRR
jgi:hypothetical protein